MPYSSILEGEEREGTYACAGCGATHFDSDQKFHSGTGWPSFAGCANDNVEVEDVTKFRYQLSGAEARCRACGGHLGDVFADGYLFPGTPAFVTGRRYCIDGAALAFLPSGGGDGDGDGDGDDDGASYGVVMGDRPPVPVDKNRGGRWRFLG
ncbi:hypothetical protein ACHAXA_007215 [Cyclostephanos tholiformis]|uniref:MsrB domain-containing protein n=1 Tax=Cyclostephanos tholiformis TaxID=382380 RepID=A0ABD3SGV5_9STRA